MSRDVDVDVVAECVITRQAIFNTLERFNAADTAAPRRQAMLEKLKADERPEIQKILAQMELARRVQSVARSTPQERQQLIQDIVAYFQQVPEGDDHALQEAVSIMIASLQLLDQLKDKSDEIAALQLYIKNLELRKDERLDGLVEMWKGASRRLNLPGNPIEIKGVTLAGEEFDVSQWKGKVVRVDVWATFCTTCIIELPSLQALYEAYHDKGFEVVGIACDEERFPVESFVERRKLPWTILFDGDEDHQGMENANAIRYGVELLPTVILIDQEGKVVSIDARGPALAEHLERLLGPPPEPKEPAEETKK
jgi:thiol-disulfide isomerase/thioredoxin